MVHRASLARHDQTWETIVSGTNLHSVAVPVFDEVVRLPGVHKRCRAMSVRLGEPCEFIYADDGSRITSWEVMSAIAASEPRPRRVRLSRNFGGQVAVVAGVGRAIEATVTVIDADLQSSSEVTPELPAR